jgi:transcriptional regulator of acetoin/glycerol metabolism
MVSDTYTNTKKHVSDVIQSVQSNTLPSLRNNTTTPVIHSSWKRCFNDYSIDPSSKNRPRIITGSELKECQEPLEEFLFIAKSGMKNLYEKIATAGYVILLGDANGVTIDYMGNPDTEREHRDAGLYLGSLWAESVEGTCGVGTCIEEKRPITIHRDEHFRARHIGLSCSTTPLFFPDGTLLGVLDISQLNPPQSRDSQLLALQMLSYSARMIENAYFMRLYKDCWIVRFNCMKAFVEVVAESFLAVNNEGYVIAANQSALTQLHAPQHPSPIGRHISAVFDLRQEELMEHATHKTTTILPIRFLATGCQYFATFRAPEQKPAIQPPRNNVRSKPSPHFTLDYLAGTDPRMSYNVNCAKRLMNSNISILLIGETGTGKEVFARAIHEASDRASKPFVALNCASIPESLIESELFGYKQGAFTGANSKGMRGKILQSSGGTLFLDEIGDMPFNLQTRLLRVLAEREVQPLGSESVIKVDLNIICATLRNLEELVREKQFREDLYYRLNGITIKLPPLRARADKELVIENALAAEAEPGSKIRLSPEALEVLAAYDWPGNIRQLRNALRFSIAICEGKIIEARDLPPDLPSSPAPGMAAPAPLPLLEALPHQDQSPAPPHLSAQDDQEQERLRCTLKKNKWNITDASRELCISRSTLYRKMNKFNIIPPNDL